MRVQIEVEKLVYGGDGLSRHEGRVVLTPYVLPAEQVTVLEKAIQKERADSHNRITQMTAKLQSLLAIEVAT